MLTTYRPIMIYVWQAEIGWGYWPSRHIGRALTWTIRGPLGTSWSSSRPRRRSEKIPQQKESRSTSSRCDTRVHMALRRSSKLFLRQQTVKTEQLLKALSPPRRGGEERSPGPKEKASTFQVLNHPANPSQTPTYTWKERGFIVFVVEREIVEGS